MVVRLDRHLRTVHHLKAKSPPYKEALRNGETVQVFEKCTTSEEEATDGQLQQVTEDFAVNYSPPQDVVSSGASRCQIDIAKTEESYHKWLFTLPGGSREPNAAKQHVSQAFTIIRNARCLFVNCSKRFWPCEHFIMCARTFRQAIECTREKKGKKRPPGTLCSYLSSISLYIEFLKEVYDSNLPTHAFDGAVHSVKIIKRTLQKLKRPRRVELQVKNHQQLVKPEDAQHFLSSDAYKRVILWLQDPVSKFNQRRAADIRNVIMTEMILQCPQRSGALASMKLSDVETAKTVTHASGKSTYIVSVHRHKTAYCFASAEMPLTAQLYKNLCLYIKHVRSGEKFDDAHVFTSANGKPLEAAAISEGVNSAWQSASCRQSHVTVTDFRKSVSTVCAEKRPALNNAVATILMSHSVPTHNKFYVQPASPAHVAALGQSIRQLMGSDVENPLPAQWKQDDVVAHIEDIPEILAGDALSCFDVELFQDTSSDLTPLQVDFPEQSYNDFKISDLFPPNDASPGTSGGDRFYQHGRHVLSKEERSVLRAAFSKHLDKGPVSMPQVKEMVRTSEDVQKIAKKHQVKTVYESLRSMSRKNRGTKKDVTLTPTE